MVHYLLLGFKKDSLTENVINGFAEKFDQLEKHHEGLVNPQIYRNIVSREGNMDLMITIEYRSFEDLKACLESPEYHELQEKYGEIVETTFSFDHN